MNQNLIIRPETVKDYYDAEMLARDSAIGYYDEPDSHLYVHKTRLHPAFVTELSYVAEADDKIVGMIMYTRSMIVTKDHTLADTLCLQHLRVPPKSQCGGIGKALLNHTIPLAKQRGYRAILFYGNPDYYPRFGFRPAFEFGIGGELNENFHCMPLYEGALDGIRGGGYCEAEIQILQSELEEFNSQFPPADRSWVKPIDYLINRLNPAAAKSIASLNLKHLYQMCRQSQSKIADLPDIDDKAIETIRRVMNECNYGWGKES